MKNIHTMAQWIGLGLALHVDDELDKVFTRGRYRDDIMSNLKGTINTAVNDVWNASSVDPIGK
jgi:hypothetical protein